MMRGNGAKMGNAEQFHRMMLPLSEGLMHYCLYLSVTRWDAEDLYQDTLLKLWGYYHSRPLLVVSKPLVVTTARRLWIDRYRKQRRYGPMMPLDQLIMTGKGTDYAGLRSLLEWMAAHLSAMQMKMLLLAAVYRNTYQEIAEEMACSVSTVRMSLHRAKRILQLSGQECPQRYEDRVDVERLTSQLMGFGIDQQTRSG